MGWEEGCKVAKYNEVLCWAHQEHLRLRDPHEETAEVLSFGVRLEEAEGSFPEASSAVTKKHLAPPV